MRAARVGDRTRLVDLSFGPPLQVLRAAYTEPELPGLAAVTICSPAGGVLQGDRLSVDVELGPGAQLRLETQSATRLYAMPDAQAIARYSFRLGPGAFLEYVPDPLIPYARAWYRQECSWSVDRSATLIVGEVVTAGRDASAEKLCYRSVEIDVDARRPDGGLLFADATRLVPDAAGHVGMLGDASVVGSLFVLSPGFAAVAFEPLADDPSLGACHAGWSDLPSQAGAWFKVVANDSGTASAAVRAAWRAARRAVLHADLPPVRRA